MIAMSRPGGGGGEGESAPRVNPEIQQAWWTGWKKLHGLKFQTVILANGMDFKIYGPVSVRHNDAYTLGRSRIEEKIEYLQRNQRLKFKMYGDSAYFDDDFMVTGGGRGMSSVRETIEWSYKDLKMTWRYCNWRNVLQLRKQPVGKIVFVCILLRNMYNCMYSSEAATYFEFLPPTLEDYLSQGVKARQLPKECIFSEEYADNDSEDNDSVDEIDNEN